jgi:hypothetical protein
MDIYKPNLIQTSFSLKHITAVLESAYGTSTYDPATGMAWSTLHA